MPSNTDASLNAAKARWNEMYQLDVQEHLKGLLSPDDLRLLANPKTPLAVYQEAFDRLLPNIMTALGYDFQPDYRDQFISEMRSRTYGLTDSDGTVIVNWKGMYLDIVKTPNLYYAIVDGVFYLPDESSVPIRFPWLRIDPSQLEPDFGPKGPDQTDNTSQGPFHLGFAIPDEYQLKPDENLAVWKAPIALFKFSSSGYPMSTLVEDFWAPYEIPSSTDLSGRPVYFLPILVEAFYSADPAHGLAVTKSQMNQEMLASGLFKPKTEYIVIGDEPQDGIGVVNLKSILKPADYDALKKYLTLMPRAFLWDFFMKKIWPSLPSGPTGMGGMGRVRGFRRGLGEGLTMGPQQVTSIYGDTHYKNPYEKMVWAAFIDMFNEANLEYVNANQLEPWVWEQKKTDAYYVSTSQTAINALEEKVSAYQVSGLAYDPKAQKIMAQYMELPRIGDTGLEINRQNALKQFLIKKDYVTAQAIVDAFRYINDTEMVTALKSPIPYDITSADGSIAVKATN